MNAINGIPIHSKNCLIYLKQCFDIMALITILLKCHMSNIIFDFLLTSVSFTYGWDPTTATRFHVVFLLAVGFTYGWDPTTATWFFVVFFADRGLSFAPPTSGILSPLTRFCFWPPAALPMVAYKRLRISRPAGGSGFVLL